MLYTVYCVLLYYCLGRKVKIVFHAYKNCSYYELNYIYFANLRYRSATFPYIHDFTVRTFTDRTGWTAWT